jgi:hypothetical protein
MELSAGPAFESARPIEKIFLVGPGLDPAKLPRAPAAMPGPVHDEAWGAGARQKIGGRINMKFLATAGIALAAASLAACGGNTAAENNLAEENIALETENLDLNATDLNAVDLNTVDANGADVNAVDTNATGTELNAADNATNVQ